MNFLAPLAFAAGLAAIPIILMYMLRLRRRELPVSSTFLWSQVLQDNEANTPWQKLRRNLLLLLQLLILALMVFALMRPFIVVPAISAGQVTILLDASASMNATDADGGRARWQAAQDEALRIVDALSSDDQMTVIRVAAVPEVIASATSDAGQLRSAIQNAAPSQAVADWTSALNLALASGTGAEDFTMVIIGDGGLPSDVGLQGTGVEIRYIAVGTSGENTAITALATAALPGRPAELYAEITNYGTLESQVTFTLRVDGERFETTNFTIPPGAALPILSSALPEGFRSIEASITPRVASPAPDHLALDNVAYAVAADGGARRVLIVSAGNVFIEQGFRSLPGVNAVRTDGALGIPDDFDLYVFDREIPSPLPPGNLLFINPQASTPYFTPGGGVDEPQNIRVADEADPRTSFLDVSGVSILRANRLMNVDWADVLVTADGDLPLVLAGEVDGRRVAVVPFALSESDLPLQITWPILLANLTEWFTPSAVIDVPDSVRVGEPITARPPLDSDAVRFIAPDGGEQTVNLSGGVALYSRTDTPGLYRVEVLQDGVVIGTETFAVNLFSPLESNIAPVPEDALTIAGAEVNLTVEDEVGQRELWPLAALLAFIVLLIEWYAYHRRLRAPTLLRPAPRPLAVGG